MIKQYQLFSLMFILINASACGSKNKAGPQDPSSQNAKSGGSGSSQSTEDVGGELTSEEQKSPQFSIAIRKFKKHEVARDWSEQSCKDVYDMFMQAVKEQNGKSPSAHYNAGVTLLKCNQEAEAEKEFDIALREAADISKAQKDPVFHQVWVQKGLIQYRKNGIPGITEAIELIQSKGFDTNGSKNVEAFVNLGMLYRERWTRDPENPLVRKKDDFGLLDDLARAQFWLQNALSINDNFMPAYNQLALYYLDKAREVGSKPNPRDKNFKKHTDYQTLQLGLLVSEEAARRDDSYASIWNSQGLILLEMGRTGAATQAFKKATEIDPKFFEAWMNYAAINLNFRGYAEAARGYQIATQIKPKDYEAKLGFAVATRGQLDYHLTQKQNKERVLGECKDPDKAPLDKCRKAESMFPQEIKEHETLFYKFYKEANVAYEDATKVDVNRPEAYFNKALLVEKYKCKAGQSSSPAEAYEEAAKLYKELQTKFESQDKYKKLVDDVRSRADEAEKAAKFERDSPSTCKKS